jgi:hypothetical protein
VATAQRNSLLNLTGQRYRRRGGRVVSQQASRAAPMLRLTGRIARLIRRLSSRHSSRLARCCRSRRCPPWRGATWRQVADSSPSGIAIDSREPGGLVRGAGPARVLVTRATGIAQPGRPIRRPQQQQEECPVSPVFGGGSAACRTLHDNLPFGRAYAPPPSPASLLQDHFKDRKLIGHCVRFNRSSGVPYLCRSVSSKVQIFPRRGDKNSTKSAMPE